MCKNVVQLQQLCANNAKKRMLSRPLSRQEYSASMQKAGKEVFGLKEGLPWAKQKAITTPVCKSPQCKNSVQRMVSRCQPLPGVFCHSAKFFYLGQT